MIDLMDIIVLMDIVDLMHIVDLMDIMDLLGIMALMDIMITCFIQFSRKTDETHACWIRRYRRWYRLSTSSNPRLDTDGRPPSTHVALILTQIDAHLVNKIFVDNCSLENRHLIIDDANYAHQVQQENCTQFSSYVHQGN